MGKYVEVWLDPNLTTSDLPRVRLRECRVCGMFYAATSSKEHGIIVQEGPRSKNNYVKTSGRTCLGDLASGFDRGRGRLAMYGIAILYVEKGS